MANQRRKKSKLVQVWVTPEQHAAIERMALRRNTTVSEAVRQVLWHASVSEALTPGEIGIAAARIEQVA